jgi:4-diphosphocytidyl-2-C-methyl-D-erythritol kinase
MTTLEKKSPCKINLLLNILGKRADGFHELETLFHPVNLCDTLSFGKTSSGINLSCDNPALPVDASNLVHRAATKFIEATKITDGVRIHLEKHIPMAAGLGGGSGNAASTLLGLNEIFGDPLSVAQLHTIAATLGSDVNFFLQSKPALASGRGEKIEPLENFLAMRGASFLLIHPGFGISTPWAYRELARFPSALNGKPGRAKQLISSLQNNDLVGAGREFYNSLEAPALEKFPIFALYQEFFRENGAAATLMSGSGSTTFAIFKNQKSAEAVVEKFKAKFGSTGWLAIVPVG